MDDRNRGAWIIVASAAGFATLGILIKYAFAGGANITTILAGRFLLAAAVMFFLLRLRGTSLAVGGKTAFQLILMGAIGYGGMSMLYANSIHYLPASLTGMLLYTYPAMVTVLAVVAGDERFTGMKALALVICTVGLVLLLGASFGGANLEGIVSVLGAAIIYSCYIVIGNRILKNVQPLVTSFYVCTAAGLTFLFYGLATGELNLNVSSTALLAIAGVAFFPTVIAVLGFFSGLRLVGATNAAIISMLEPLITVLLSALLLGERITGLQGCGGLVLLSGALILQLWGGDARRPVAETKLATDSVE